MDPSGYSVQCHTDLETCCSGTQGQHRGDWYFPNGTRLPFSTNVGGIIYEACGEQRVDIHHRNNPNSPSGIHRCDIPTEDVHDYNDNSAKETVYVGLYAMGGDIKKHLSKMFFLVFIICIPMLVCYC